MDYEKIAKKIINNEKITSQEYEFFILVNKIIFLHIMKISRKWLVK